jgi:hypothetical protein
MLTTKINTLMPQVCLEIHMGLLDRLLGKSTRNMRESIAKLMENTKSEDLEIRKSAIIDLGNYDNPEVVAHLAESLRDNHLNAYAAQSLLRSQNGRDALLSIIGPQSDSLIRANAIGGLEKGLINGAVQKNDATKNLIGKAIKENYGKKEIVSLLRLLHLTGDLRAQMIGKLAQAGAGAQMEEMIRDL